MSSNRLLRVKNEHHEKETTIKGLKKTSWDNKQAPYSYTKRGINQK